MTDRWVRTRHPLVYEIDTWPWLTELGDRTGVPTTLATVPDAQWDDIAADGFDAVWLMGVWQRSPAGVAVALANRANLASFTAALPDWSPADVVGSPYCIQDYVVDDRLGGRMALAAARSALADRGVALLLDFVPNHVAIDHPWTSDHPEFFVRGTQADLRSAPESFVDVGGTVLANGRDPYFPAWTDVVQLDAFSSALRAEMIDTLRDIATQCDGVRCDMAMLVMNDVFTGTWGARVGEPPAQEYWPALVDAVRRTHPDFTLIAEAYWDLESALQQQGFDFCYDKRLYDHLGDGDAASVRKHLAADAGFQDRLLRFVENHDEPRAASIFAPRDRQEAVTVAALTQSGARLVHQGQLEGRRVHLPVFLGRMAPEAGDPETTDFHRRLLQTLRDDTLRNGDCHPCDVSGGPDDSPAKLVAWCWDGDRRWLIVVNLGDATASGRVRAPWGDLRGESVRLSEPLCGNHLDRTGDELCAGLRVDLAAWQWHLYEIEIVEAK